MPLSGEAIRMMNYVDDVATTMRRLLAVAPTLTNEERKRVSEYLRAVDQLAVIFSQVRAECEFQN